MVGLVFMLALSIAALLIIALGNTGALTWVGDKAEKALKPFKGSTKRKGRGKSK